MLIASMRKGNNKYAPAAVPCFVKYAGRPVMTWPHHQLLERSCCHCHTPALSLSALPSIITWRSGSRHRRSWHDEARTVQSKGHFNCNIDGGVDVG
jgi:hypothetical protein